MPSLKINDTAMPQVVGLPLGSAVVPSYTGPPESIAPGSARSITRDDLQFKSEFDTNNEELRRIGALNVRPPLPPAPCVKSKRTGVIYIWCEAMAAQSDEYVCCDDDGNEDPKAWEGRTPEGFGMGIDGALPPPIVIKESTDPVTVVVGLPLSEAPTLQSMPGMVVGLPPGAQNRFTPPEVE